MDEKQVNGFIDGLIDFIGTIFTGVADATDSVPSIVIGWVVIILGVIWLLRRARGH